MLNEKSEVVNVVVGDAEPVGEICSKLDFKWSGRVVRKELKWQNPRTSKVKLDSNTNNATHEVHEHTTKTCTNFDKFKKFKLFPRGIVVLRILLPPKMGPNAAVIKYKSNVFLLQSTQQMTLFVNKNQIKAFFCWVVF